MYMAYALGPLAPNSCKSNMTGNNSYRERERHLIFGRKEGGGEGGFILGLDLTALS